VYGRHEGRVGTIILQYWYFYVANVWSLEAQFFRIPSPIGPGTVPFGTSPVGPSFHDSWVDPLGTIAGYAVG
jgi:hypothetical protein